MSLFLNDEGKVVEAERAAPGWIPFPTLTEQEMQDFERAMAVVQKKTGRYCYILENAELNESQRWPVPYSTVAFMYQACRQAEQGIVNICKIYGWDPNGGTV